MAVIDARGVVVGWSAGAGRLTGYGAAEVVGRPAARLLAGEPVTAWRALRRDGRAEVSVRRRDGGRTRAAPPTRGSPVRLVR